MTHAEKCENCRVTYTSAGALLCSRCDGEMHQRATMYRASPPIPVLPLTCINPHYLHGIDVKRNLTNGMPSAERQIALARALLRPTKMDIVPLKRSMTQRYISENLGYQPVTVMHVLMRIGVSVVARAAFEIQNEELKYSMTSRPQTKNTFVVASTTEWWLDINRYPGFLASELPHGDISFDLYRSMRIDMERSGRQWFFER